MLKGRLEKVLTMEMWYFLLFLLHLVTPEVIYTNQFAVHVPKGEEEANEIARKYGFINTGQIGSLKGFFLFEHERVNKRSTQPHDGHQRLLSKETEIKWFQQQHEKKRYKRDVVTSERSRSSSMTTISPPTKLGHSIRAASTIDTFPDPLFPEQWYLNSGAKDGLDMNVGKAWKKGYTGKGVVVSILDDGIQTNHPDLAQNYDPLASTDINGNDDDPTPQDNGDNKHGTRCAGEVAAVAFNQYCGIGVAYNASIGGVRMLDGVVNDAVEAKALGLNPEHIDIYSASWGPEDDGKTVDGPGPLAKRAFIYGVTSGRKGKGSIFVWASGNGGRHIDSCNCDGYTNSIFTLSISSATQEGYKPWYLEECSSTLATTYSSGTPGRDKSIVTVDMDPRLRPDHMCTEDHTGTSASAPLAAGICALALEANPTLTWRDIQYLVLLTSRSTPLEKEPGWITNGVKRKVSHKFGYGLMDAGALVNLAEIWTTAPQQHICKSQELIEDKPIESTLKSTLTLHMDVNACKGTLNEVRYLEHVQCKVSLNFFPRGNLKILLTSPMGTTSILLFERPRDIVSSTFDDWPFLSVHFWGEQALGRWTLQVINSGNKLTDRAGVFKKWQLILYGTQMNPVRVKNKNVNGNDERNKIQPYYVNRNYLKDNYYNTKEFRQDKYFNANERENSINVIHIKSKNGEIRSSCHEQCDEQGCFGRGPNKCISCRNKRINKTCVSVCPPRTYANNDGFCNPCHESCFTCTGPTQDSCQTCSPGYLLVIDLEICIQQCPDGYFEDLNEKICISCQPNCASCEGRPDSCIRCDYNLILFGNKCMGSCPANTFQTDDHSCGLCHQSCETCHGLNSSQCISCNEGKFWHDGRCVNDCPAHHYGDPNQRECIECSPGCSECNKTTCLSCLEDWQINTNGRCVPHDSDRCDSDQYNDGGSCKPCHSTCETCDGPTAHACLSCSQPFILQGTKCVSTCDSGFFQDKILRWCIPCLHTCSECESKSNCTLCTTGLQLQNGECLSTCSRGYYEEKGVCERCYMSCDTCLGRDYNQCITCPYGWQLISGECRPDCLEGYYKTEYGCQKCHVACSNCPGCETQTDKRKINLETYVVSAQDVSALELVNPFGFVTGLAAIACLCIIILFMIIFLVLQRNSAQSRRKGYSRVSIKKPKITCNYHVVAVADADSTDSDDTCEEHNLITQPKIKRTTC
ncbi:furin-like protease 2 isoform X1 [Onthophagus taurus]|uniref:furin-like protease 2 isoform X1 n=2 Tax=Onthophagus taurus TaxID=166361 RepID=UPI0039BE2FAC